MSVSKRVLLAAPRGYCAGVERAVATVEMALEQYKASVYVRKQMVHNKYAVRALEPLGAVFVEQATEVPRGFIIVLSAHGVAPTGHDEVRTGQLGSIDAMCPLVTKVHIEAARFAAEDYDIRLIGHAGHEEVVGVKGQAPRRIQVMEGWQEAGNVDVNR